MPFTQTDRLLRIDTPLGPDVLILRSFTGAEGLSQLYKFELDLFTEGPAINFADIIGKPVTIRVELFEDNERFFHGVISRFAQTGSETGIIHYRAEMVPWLWFLTRTADCRIFQNKKIPDILEKIFSDLGMTDYRFDLKGTYEPREYCVQYRETDFNFVSRLMEQYGIFYFFEHDKDKHMLVIGDHPNVHGKLPTQPTVEWEPKGNGLQEEDVITSLEFEKELRPGKFAHTDYNFKTPGTSLMANVPSVINIGGNNKFEIYDFPGEYETKQNGESLGKIRMEEEEARHLVMTGGSTVRAFTPGYTFTLENYFPTEMNQAYLLTHVHHMGTMGNSYSTGGQAGGGEETYSNTFACIPASVPFRPPLVTPKPVVQGPQTAVVTGPGGEEIWCDEYGRVIVQFHWDREGKRNEMSSCWVRVSQFWAGKNWGAMFIPRIGHEVIVEFLEGDPDRPIATGRVYNAENMPPYPLPAEHTKSTIKSNSSKGGGNSNELRFEDKAGSEEVYLHGAKDWTIAIDNDKNQTVGHDETQSIGNDRTRSVGHDESISITNNRTKSVGVDQSESVGSNKSINVGSNHDETIGANKTLNVGGNHSETIGGNEIITVGIAAAHTIAAAKALTIGAAYQVSVGGAMNETIGGLKAEEIGGLKSVNVGAASSENVLANKSVDAGGNISESAGKNFSMSAGDNMAETAGKDVTIKAGKKMLLDAGDEIIIQTGKAKIQMKKNGDIVIEGKKISIKASGDIVMKGKKILQN
jgi:type VI secretion system secreted protein VgrG